MFQKFCIWKSNFYLVVKHFKNNFLAFFSVRVVFNNALDFKSRVKNLYELKSF